MKSFTEILSEVGKTDKNTSHTYGRIYDLWFADRRQTAKNVLEVGVCQFGGGCVLALSQYFTNATIWASDISFGPCCNEVFSSPRIIRLEGDAYAPNFLFSQVPECDIIIDDACHEIEKQVGLLETLTPLIAQKGLYCVEDCVADQWTAHLSKLRKMGLRHTIIDMATELAPDNTIIIFDRA